VAPDAYTLGPEQGELLVHTRREGAAARAGHDLEIVVGHWLATLELGESLAASLSAASSSLRVREGRGGIQALDDADKENINRAIREEVLKGTTIEFRSTTIVRASATVQVQGELELMGLTRPLAFEVRLTPGGKLAARATVKQTDWGMKPYSALLGALRVADEVEITLEADLRSGDQGRIS
jgi:YceI-like domain